MVVRATIAFTCCGTSVEEAKNGLRFESVDTTVAQIHPTIGLLTARKAGVTVVRATTAGVMVALTLTVVPR